jgi:hypothetical protein
VACRARIKPTTGMPDALDRIKVNDASRRKRTPDPAASVVAPANENRTVALLRAKAKSVPGVAAVPVSLNNRRQNVRLPPRPSRRSAT